MSYNKTDVKALQKAINNLKTFKPKCGRLKENGMFDLDTVDAVNEFITACKHNKLMAFFEKSPYETYLLIKLITDVIATKDSPVLKRLFIYHRKDIQRLVWHMGIKHYLRHNDKYPVAADLLAHSLKEHPGTVRWDEYSEGAQKIKETDIFKNKVKEFMDSHPSYYETRSRFYGNASLDFGTSNSDDLYLSLGKANIKFHAGYKEGIGWVVNCTVFDRYDFDAFREMGFKKVFTEGLNAIRMGSVANNAGLLSQYDGVIHPYDISITFPYIYKE